LHRSCCTLIATQAKVDYKRCCIKAALGVPQRQGPELDARNNSKRRGQR
jgi:hypothetical protein